MRYDDEKFNRNPVVEEDMFGAINPRGSYMSLFI
jgi:hypothetical protein